MSSKLLLKNMSMMAILQMANIFFPLLITPYLLRVLGVSQFGVYAIAQAMAAYALLVVEYGFNLSAVREIACSGGGKKEVSAIFWNVFFSKTVLAFLGTLVMLGIPFVSTDFFSMRSVIYAGIPLVWGTVLFPQFFFQGVERMGFITVSMLLARALNFFMIIALVRSANDVVMANFLMSMVTVAAGLLSVIFIRKNGLVGKPDFSDISVLRTLRNGWHLFLSQISVSFFTLINPIVLGHYAGRESVGYFTAADKIRNAVQSLLAPISNAVYPRVNALLSSDRDKAKKLIVVTLVGQTLMMAFISVMLYLFREDALRFFAGKEYSSAENVLAWVCWVPLMSAVSYVLGIYVMIPMGMQRQFSGVLVLAAFIHVGVLFILVPYGKEVGVAQSVVITEAAILFMMAIFLSFRFWKKK